MTGPKGPGMNLPLQKGASRPYPVGAWGGSVSEQIPNDLQNLRTEKQRGIFIDATENFSAT